MQTFVAHGIPWNAASNPEMKSFVKRWIPGVTLQDHHILSGHILDGEVAKVDARVV
jgi:hypothetical protein